MYNPFDLLYNCDISRKSSIDFRLYSVMSTPLYLDQRSIFSYPPPSDGQSAKEVAWQSRNNNNTGIDSEKFPNIMDCPKEIHCTVSDGLKFENQPCTDGEPNWGIYATKLFPKHSVVFISRSIGYVYDKDVDYKLIIDPEGK